MNPVKMNVEEPEAGNGQAWEPVWMASGYGEGVIDRPAYFARIIFLLSVWPPAFSRYR